MNPDSIIRDAVRDIPKVVAAGIIDLNLGILLSLSSVDSHPEEVVDMLGPATKAMFEGEMVLKIERAFEKARGPEMSEHYFQEILIASRHLWHYFGRVRSNPQSVLAVVARGDVNMGLFLIKVRAIKDVLEV